MAVIEASDKANWFLLELVSRLMRFPSRNSAGCGWSRGGLANVYLFAAIRHLRIERWDGVDTRLTAQGITQNAPFRGAPSLTLPLHVQPQSRSFKTQA